LNPPYFYTQAQKQRALKLIAEGQPLVEVSAATRVSIGELHARGRWGEPKKLGRPKKVALKAEKRVRGKILARSQGAQQEEPFAASVAHVRKADKAARVLSARQWRRKLDGAWKRPRSRLKFQEGDVEARLKWAKSEQKFLGQQKGNFLLAHLDVSFLETGASSTSRRKGRYFGQEQKKARDKYVVRKSGMKESASKTHCLMTVAVMGKEAKNFRCKAVRIGASTKAERRLFNESAGGFAAAEKSAEAWRAQMTGGQEVAGGH
jgi:hypothetical protein